jgi:hypothetical protein
MAKRTSRFTRSFCRITLLAVAVAASTAANLVIPASALKQPQSQIKANSLLAVLREPNIRKTDPRRLQDAIAMAGQTKLVEAINDLAKLITFNEEEIYPPPSIVKSTERADRYPAASALFLIGKPALPVLISLVETHKVNDAESKIAASTILSIFRESKTEGIEYLTATRSKAKSAETKRRISLLINNLEKF